ncbi:hypothetical protein IAR50_000858 [Cryptococcus sp. DSM 104548]
MSSPFSRSYVQQQREQAPPYVDAARQYSTHQSRRSPPPSFKSQQQKDHWNTKEIRSSYIDTPPSVPSENIHSFDRGDSPHYPQPATSRFDTAPSGRQYEGQNIRSVHDVPRQSPWAPSTTSIQSALTGPSRSTTAYVQEPMQSLPSRAAPPRRFTAASSSVNNHNFGMEPKSIISKKYKYDERSVFWNANMPFSDTEKVTSAYSDWLDKRATDAKSEMDREEDDVKKKRDVDVPRQSARTDDIYRKITDTVSRLRNVVQKSGDTEAISQFNILAERLGDLSAELNAERGLREDTVKSQVRATDAAWKGWRVTKRGVDVVSGNASLDDARSLWKSYKGDKATSRRRNSLRQEDSWNTMMSNLEDTSTGDILEAFEESFDNNYDRHETLSTRPPQATLSYNDSFTAGVIPFQAQENDLFIPSSASRHTQGFFHHPQTTTANHQRPAATSSAFFRQPRQ